MKFLDLTLDTPQRNLACDDALIETCEEEDGHEVLRFWEPREHFVVVGYSNSIHSEVDLPSCRKFGFPVLRRLSGGGAILQGPGCLNYAIILKIIPSGPLGNITGTNRYIMRRHQTALEAMTGSRFHFQGHTDLTIGNLKVSGNAQYRKRRFLLFHGTFLINLDISLVDKLLPLPSKQPPYRQSRSHADFLTNLHVDPAGIKEALKSSWNATKVLNNVPSDKINRIVKDRYSKEGWNFKF